jgi:hypothetical protein
VNMLAITTAPVADGVMGVCIAGEIDTETCHGLPAPRERSTII